MTIHVPNLPDEHGKAILWIGQVDGRLIGCVGETEERQKCLKNLTVERGDLTFNFDVRNGITTNVHLREAEGHLAGTGKGGVDIDFDLRPTSTVHTLYEKVVNLDRRLFDAYNRRDLETIEGMFTKDLEFFHDKDGLTGYLQNIHSFRKLFSEQSHYRRELDTDSLEVYPVRGYGAMEVGVHRFFTTNPGEPETLTATAKFVHIWVEENGSWRISRVVSYDHE